MPGGKHHMIGVHAEKIRLLCEPSQEANREESPKSPLINAWATEPPIYDTALPIEALEDLPLPDVKSGFTLFTHKSVR